MVRGTDVPSVQREGRSKQPQELQRYNRKYSISIVFSALINQRLSDLLEKRGILGQIPNGGRKNRQGLDSLFVLRTILEKKSGNGHNNLGVFG